MNFIFCANWNHPSLALTIRKNNVAQFIHSPWITHCFVEDLDAVRIATKEIPRNTQSIHCHHRGEALQQLDEQADAIKKIGVAKQ